MVAGDRGAGGGVVLGAVSGPLQPTINTIITAFVRLYSSGEGKVKPCGYVTCLSMAACPGGTVPTLEQEDGRGTQRNSER